MKKLLFSALMMSASIFSYGQQPSVMLRFPEALGDGWGAPAEWGGTLTASETGGLVLNYTDRDQYSGLVYTLNNSTDPITLDLTGGAYVTIWAKADPAAKLRVDLRNASEPTTVGPNNRVGNVGSNFSTASIGATQTRIDLPKYTKWEQAYSADTTVDGPVNPAAITHIDILAVDATAGAKTYTGTITIDSIYIGTSPFVATSVKRPNFVSSSTVVSPNPASDQVSVSYSLTSSSNMKLTLKDMVGRDVAVLSEGVRTPGAIQESVNIKGVPSGLYYLTFEVDGVAVKSEKLMVK